MNLQLSLQTCSWNSGGGCREDSGGTDGGGTVSVSTGAGDSGLSPSNTFIWKFRVLPF